MSEESEASEFCGAPCEMYRSAHGPVRCGLLAGHPGNHHFVFAGNAVEKTTGMVWESGRAHLVGWERLRGGVWEIRVVIESAFPADSEERRVYEEAVMTKLLQDFGRRPPNV